MIRFIIFFLLMVFSLSVFSQERILHKKQMYKAEDGKLYIQKTLPVYLYISTSDADDAEIIKLESEDSKKYTNPLYFDTEGYNSIRTPSKVDTVTKKIVYPVEDIIFEVYSDSRAPKTFIKNRNKGYLNAGKRYFSGEFSLDFEASDVHSGVNTIYYSINESKFEKFSKPIQLLQEKEYRVVFYAIDNVGNAEENKSETIIIDKTKPQTQVMIKGDRHENIISARSSIVIDVVENSSGVNGLFYKIGDGQVKPFKYPILASWFSEGEHSISYYAIDNVGNKEEWNTFEFFVDKTPPIIVDEIMGNTFMANGIQYSSGRSKYKISSIDNKAGVKSIHYQVGNGLEQIYTEPFYLQSSGNLKIKVWAYDNVNNRAVGGSSNQRNGASYVDLAGPVLSYKFSGPFFNDRDTVFISTTTKIKLIATDVESGMDRIMYSLDDAQETEYNEMFSVKAQGLHSIKYTGYDKVGNSNNGQFIFVVDDVSPRINVNFSVEPIGSKTALDKRIEVYPSHLQVFLSATDDLAGLRKIQYKIDNGAFREYSSPLNSFLGGRDYKVFIKAEDKLGNVSEKEFEISIN